MNIKTVTLCLALLAGFMPARAHNFAGESLNYQIVYQWGMIWKHAGDATLSMSKKGTGYQATLTGKTRSWADKFYPVRDTLKCTLNSKLQPLKYEKLTHENSYYARDVVDFSYNYSHTSAKCYRYRANKPTETIELSAKCQAYDMLSVFYMLRTIDYDELARDKSVTTVIFSGKEKEYLTIRYKGREKIKLRDGSRREAYHITFKFTQKSGKRSSDDLDAWMSADASRTPLQIEGKLPVGKVKCYMTK